MRGYYTAANGAGTQYYYVNGESAKAYDIDGVCTLYAKWTANTYDVVLNASGGSGGSTVTAAYDSDMPDIAAPDTPGDVLRRRVSHCTLYGHRLHTIFSCTAEENMSAH